MDVFNPLQYVFQELLMYVCMYACMHVSICLSVHLYVCLDISRNFTVRLNSKFFTKILSAKNKGLLNCAELAVDSRDLVKLAHTVPAQAFV